MDNKLLDDFVERYDITSVSHSKDSDYNNRYSFAQSATSQLTYRNGSQQSVDVVISMRGLEHMVSMDNKAEQSSIAEVEDRRICRKYPAVETAYTQYKMLLELHR